jgi:hypothetical protein
MAAAPIVIHLWMRQAHRETPWAAVRFLQAAIERQARRLRLEQWVLLALRTLVLLLVALAAAKPFLESSALGGAPKHRVIVLDASASMGLVEGGPDAGAESRLELAKRLVGEMISRSVPGDRWSLHVLSANPSAPVARPTSDGGAVARAAAAVEITQGVASVPRWLALAERTLAESPGQGPRPEVLVFTDLGANSWRSVTAIEGRDEGGSAEAKPTHPQGATAVDRVAKLAKLSIIDLADRSASNAAVTRLAPPAALPTIGRPIELTADVSLLGVSQARDVTAELLVDGAPVARQRVRVAPGRPAPVVFASSINEPGIHEVCVALEGSDALAVDDRRSLALDLRDKVRVLCVEGARDAAAYVADALAPIEPGEGALETTVVSDADLPSIDFARFACIVFCNVPELTRADGARVAAYVAGGGGAIFFLGDRVEHRRYNEVLGIAGSEQALRRGKPRFRLVSDSTEEESPRTEPLLPLTIDPPVSEPTYRIDPLDYAHPIVAPFRGRERSGLLTIPVLRRFPLRIDAESLAAGRVSLALALEGGAPLLVTSQHGAGRVAVVSTDGSLASIDPATGDPWTALPAWPSFLPIVRGMVNYVAQGGGAAAPRLVGEPLAGPLPAGAFAADSLRIVRPDGTKERAQAGADSLSWSYPRSDVAGVYRVALGDAASSAVAALAVNIDPAESDPTPIDAARLPAAFRVEQASRDAGTTQAITAAGRAELARWLLTLALVLLLVEGAVACWFGRRGA